MLGPAQRGCLLGVHAALKLPLITPIAPLIFAHWATQGLRRTIWRMYLPFNLLNTDPVLAPARPALGQRRTARGFSLLEVMVVVAILGILASLAAPSFTPIIERWRVRQAAEDLRSSIYYARSEAIKRGGGVVIHKLPPSTNGCTGSTNTSNWDCGWFVCEDLDNNGACNTKDPVLQRVEAPKNIEITRKGGASIKLNRWGLIDGNFLGFSLVPMGKSTINPASLGVCMSSAGRIRIIQLKDGQCDEK